MVVVEVVRRPDRCRAAKVAGEVALVRINLMVALLTDAVGEVSGSKGHGDGGSRSLGLTIDVRSWTWMRWLQQRTIHPLTLPLSVVWIKRWCENRRNQ